MELNKELLKNPPEHVRRLALTVFEAMALEELIREKINPVKLDCARIVKAVHKRTGEPITDINQLYMMSREKFKEWDEEYRWELKKMGYTSDRYQKEGICPHLETESLLRDAQHALVEGMEEITGILDKDLSWKLKEYKAYVELILTYLSQFVKTDKEKREHAGSNNI